MSANVDGDRPQDVLQGKPSAPPRLAEGLLKESQRKARQFLDREQQFRLGVLPIEQSNPKTVGLAETARQDLEAAIRMLHDVDADLGPVVARGLASEQFAQLLAVIRQAMTGKGRICFSGCGATGRLSILLEAGWRHFWQSLRVGHPTLAAELPSLEDRVLSIMTGGDFALVRSVEKFEDYAIFGRRQVQEAGIGEGDVLVGITGTGETSSIVGTLWQALDNGAKAFLVLNTPPGLLVQHIERSRQLLEDGRVTLVDLTCGAMAVTGSTRMQSTTTQLLVLGAALELTLVEMLRTHLDAADFERLGITVRQPGDYAALFSQLLNDLGQPQSTEALAAMVRYEEHLYRRKGLVTYMADRCLLDVFTDTTERSPTFMLPPFRRHSDRASPPPWAFAKNPRLPTPQAWRQLLAREPRCLEWDSNLYRELGAPASLQENPPRLAASDMLDFLVGNEDDPSRYATVDNAAILIASGEQVRQMTAPDDALRTAFARCARPFAQHAALAIGPEPMPAGLVPAMWHVPVRLPASPLQLWDRLAVKLVAQHDIHGHGGSHGPAGQQHDGIPASDQQEAHRPWHACGGGTGRCGLRDGLLCSA